MTPEDRCKILEMQLAEMTEAYGVESRIAQRRGEELDQARRVIAEGKECCDAREKAFLERDAALEKVKELLERVEKLREAIQECSQQPDDKGKSCWCHIPSMIPYRGHDAGCRAAREALGIEDEP